ncbi:hypothetical protein LIER_38929 [Lithospermum erythrorhizon]|uniref:Uncharacterized protein n=1 Tax=Lithospermum erythrorhizon TaxID=34254 RepID=A0AAV3Q7A9_LITER
MCGTKGSALLYHDRRQHPLFRRAKVTKPSADEFVVPVEKVTQPAVSVTKKPSMVPEKRHAPTEERPRLFTAKRLKSIAHKMPRSEILDLTEDPPSSTIPSQEWPKDCFGLNPSTSESFLEEESDFAPKAKSGYSVTFLTLPYTLPGGFRVNKESNIWKKSDAFRASRPLLLERIKKDYDSIRDPLEIHGAVACHLIKVASSLYFTL